MQVTIYNVCDARPDSVHDHHVTHCHRQRYINANICGQVFIQKPRLVMVAIESISRHLFIQTAVNHQCQQRTQMCICNYIFTHTPNIISGYYQDATM